MKFFDELWWRIRKLFHIKGKVSILKSKPRKKSLLCSIGIHQWSKPRSHYIVGSNVVDFEQHCKRCGVRKRFVRPKDS